MGPPLGCYRSPSLDKDRYTEIEGLGPVPNGPRAERHRRHQTGSQASQLRLSSRRSQDANDRHQQESGGTKSSSREPEIKIENDEGLASSPVRPEYDNSLQYLEEMFSRRRREMREEGMRERVGPGQRTYDIASAEEQRQFYSRDEKYFRRDLADERRGEGHQAVKREQPEDSRNSSQSTSAQRPDVSQSPNSSSLVPSTGVRARRSQNPPVSGDVTPGCRCPINRDCPRRKNELIDCRTLVIEYQKWKKRHAEDVPSQLPPDTSPEGEPPLSLAEVKQIIKLLDQVETRSRLSMGIRSIFGQIEAWSRKMQNFPVTRELVDDSRVLERLKAFLAVEDGQRVLDVPENITEDLTFLYRKWDSGDFEVLATRGLVQHREAGSYYPDPAWAHTRNDNFFGHGHLVNGQTWRRRSEMSRDGAHGPLMAGIAGTVEEGARSVVTGFHDAKNLRFYADIDEGETIWYIGTALPRQPGDDEATNVKDSSGHRPSRVTKNSKGDGPTNATKALVKSYSTGHPVRVFRSFRLAEIVPLRPEKGFRYDGLYRVTRYELLKRERQIYRFKMERLATGQGPLRQGIAMPDQESRSTKRRRDER